MTENTLENKLQFFAQYYGQEVAVIHGLLTPTLTKTRIDSSYRDYLKLPTLLSIQYLELTPLSSITDEDVKAAGFANIRHFNLSRGSWKFIAFESDILRSRGYLIQWRDLTPDQLISYGWVKVKN